MKYLELSLILVDKAAHCLYMIKMCVMTFIDTVHISISVGLLIQFFLLYLIVTIDN